MKRVFKSLIVPMVISLLSLTCASSTTNLTWVWKDPAYQGGRVDSVMVIGVAKNQTRRQMFEDHFVEEFKKGGVNAVSSAAVIPVDKEMTKEIVLVEVEKLGMDAILVTHLTALKTEDKFVPPSTSVYPHSRYARFDMYTYATGDYTKYGGSYSKKSDIQLETNLYDAESQMIIWSGKSQSIDAKYVSEVIDSLCREVITDLRKKKLIQ